MIDYRFLSVAGDEMSEAAVFYRAEVQAWEATFSTTCNSRSTDCACIRKPESTLVTAYKYVASQISV